MGLVGVDRQIAGPLHVALLHPYRDACNATRVSGLCCMKQACNGLCNVAMWRIQGKATM